MYFFSGCWTSPIPHEQFQTPDGCSDGSPYFLISAEMILESMLFLLGVWGKGKGFLRFWNAYQSALLNSKKLSISAKPFLNPGCLGKHYIYLEPVLLWADWRYNYFFWYYSLSCKIFERVFVLGDSQAIWPELHSECLRPPVSLASSMLTIVCMCWSWDIIVSPGGNCSWKKMRQVLKDGIKCL